MKQCVTPPVIVLLLLLGQQQTQTIQAFTPVSIVPPSSSRFTTTTTTSTTTATTRITQMIHQASIEAEAESQYNIDTATDTPTFDSNKASSSSSSPWPTLPESTYTQVMSSLDLQPIATKLRKSYDEHFHDPRQPDTNGKRFCWDPWFVRVGDGLAQKPPQHGHGPQGEVDADEAQEIQPQPPQQQQIMLEGEQEAIHQQTQYSLKRIQSNNFFTDDEFSDLVEDLTALGRSIGLTAITPPWISLYTHGDMQNFHTDAPHGPIAFVLSLSQPHHFTGGETMLLQPHILELWRGFDGSKGLEMGNIMRYIPPTPLGKCIVFDPRVPHGVNQVAGTMDPRRGRVAVHGWLNQPEVCWFGPWGSGSDDDHSDPNSEHDADADAGADVVVGRMNAMLDEALQPLVETLGSGEIGRVVGYLACRVEVDTDGYVDDVYGVCDTLQADYDDFRGVVGYDESNRPVMEDAVSDVKLTVYETLKNLYFEEGGSGRSVVVPFAFE